jgi:hypothetical protein
MPRSWLCTVSKAGCNAGFWASNSCNAAFTLSEASDKTPNTLGSTLSERCVISFADFVRVSRNSDKVDWKVPVNCVLIESKKEIRPPTASVATSGVCWGRACSSLGRGAIPADLLLEWRAKARGVPGKKAKAGVDDIKSRAETQHLENLMLLFRMY